MYDIVWNHSTILTNPFWRLLKPENVFTSSFASCSTRAGFKSCTYPRCLIWHRWDYDNWYIFTPTTLSPVPLLPTNSIYHGREVLAKVSLDSIPIISFNDCLTVLKLLRQTYRPTLWERNLLRSGEMPLLCDSKAQLNYEDGRTYMVAWKYRHIMLSTATECWIISLHLVSFHLQ